MREKICFWHHLLTPPNSHPAPPNPSLFSFLHPPGDEPDKLSPQRLLLPEAAYWHHYLNISNNR